MSSFQESALVFIKEHIEEIQLHDKTLTLEQKQNMLSQWLEYDPHYFIKQLKTYLPMDLLALYYDNLQINDSDNDESIDQQQPTTKVSIKKQHNIIRNRRYHYLVHHLRAEGYFSDDNIQLRYPVLHEEFIGQYIPKEEKYAPFKDDMTLVERVYHGMDNRYVKEEYEKHKRTEEEQFEEEEDDDDDEEEEEEEEEEMDKGKVKKEKEDEMNEQDLINSNEWESREEKHEELVRLLEEQWVDGLDTTFDYSIVDNNELYDDLIQENQDIQDQYFDDEPEDVNIINTDTGVLDY